MKFKFSLIAIFLFGSIWAIKVSASDDSTKKLEKTIVGKTFSYIEDKFNNFFENTEIEITGNDAADPDFSIFTVQPLNMSSDGKDLTFFQGSIIRKNNRDTLNTGLGFRNLSDDKNWIYGINVFHDYDMDYEHSRMSLGAELKGSAFDINANKYWAITGAKTGEDGNTERALDGHEFEVGGQVPYIPSAKLYAKMWTWEGYGSASDTKGKTYSLEINTPIMPNVTLEAGTKDYDDQTDRDFIKMTYRLNFGETKNLEEIDIISDQAFSSKSVESRMLEKVRRKNSIVIQTNFSSAAGGV